jgi:hypothetical protein
MKGILTLTILAAACGSKAPAGPQRVTMTSPATIDGQPFDAHDAATIKASVNGKQTANLLVTNLSNSCEANAKNLKNKQVLSVGIVPAGNDLTAISYGVFDSASHTIPSGNYAVVEYHATNAICDDSPVPNTLGASGRVTLARVDLGADGGVKGDFDIILQNGDRLKGNFDSPLCGAIPDADAGCH